MTTSQPARVVPLAASVAAATAASDAAAVGTAACRTFFTCAVRSISAVWPHRCVSQARSNHTLRPTCVRAVEGVLGERDDHPVLSGCVARRCAVVVSRRGAAHKLPAMSVVQYAPGDAVF
jgi:hypothetical protein